MDKSSEFSSRRTRRKFAKNTTASTPEVYTSTMQGILLILGLSLASGLALPFADSSRLYWQALNISEVDAKDDSGSREASSRDLCNCGFSSLSSRIVGGEQAREGEFPWQVQVASTYYNKSDGNHYIGGCGGTILSSKWILSATHCFVDNKGRGEKEIKSIDIYAGAIGKNKGTKYTASNLVNMNYDIRSKIHDLSLVELSSPITFNDKVGPACLPYELRGNTEWTGDVWASGWGTLEFQGPSPDNMQKVKLDAISNQDCNQRGMGIQDSQICTFTEGKDTCQGDSGGPIAARLSNGKFSVLGVTSYGRGCASDTPGVYTRVSEYINVIENTTGEQFCKN